MAFNLGAKGCPLPPRARNTDIADGFAKSRGADVAFTESRFTESDTDSETSFPSEVIPMMNNFNQRDTRPTTESASTEKPGEEVRGTDRDLGDAIGTGDGCNQACEEVHRPLSVGQDIDDDAVVVTREFSQAITASRGTGFRSDGTPREAFVITRKGIRRHTPREHERLQGMPDDYTAITYRGKAATDSPRYKALGNSMVVPVLQWLGRRIAEAFTLTDPPGTRPKFLPPVPKALDWVLREKRSNPQSPETTDRQ